MQHIPCHPTVAWHAMLAVALWHYKGQ